MIRRLIFAVVAVHLGLACTGPVASPRPKPPQPAASGCGPWQGDAAELSTDPRSLGVQLIQRQHSGEVWSLLGLAGGMVASGGDDNTGRIWDLDTRTLVCVFRARQLVGRGRRGHAVIVEGYKTKTPEWSELTVREGRVSRERRPVLRYGIGRHLADPR